MNRETFTLESAASAHLARRIALGFSANAFAERAGITVEELIEYEAPPPNTVCDLEVAARVREALQEIEAERPLFQ